MRALRLVALALVLIAPAAHAVRLLTLMHSLDARAVA